MEGEKGAYLEPLLGQNGSLKSRRQSNNDNQKIQVDELIYDERNDTLHQKYYNHWRDFDMLTTILAMIGLTLAIVEVIKTISFKSEFES